MLGVAIERYIKARLQEEVKKYDLRSVRVIYWSCDTWDGSISPVNGIRWQTTFAAMNGKIPDIIGSSGRVYDNGVRESRAHQGDPVLADHLEDLHKIFQKLCEKARLVLEGSFREVVCWKTDFPEMELEKLRLFLQHPTYQEVFVSGTNLLISYDEKTRRWTFEKKPPGGGIKI